MTTPEICMWAATALNAGGACYYAWLIRRHNRLHGNLMYIAKEFVNELQKRFELIRDVMRLTSERNDLREGAAFEARVAKKLAKKGDRIIASCSSKCPWHKMDPKDTFACIGERHGKEFCRLREARLSVEEEMDRADH